MQIPENVAERVREKSINSIVDKYKNITDIKCDGYKQLCAAYRRAMDDKDKELADRLYKLMYSIQKKKRPRVFNYLPSRRNFWDYVKGLGRHKIFSAKDIDVLYIKRENLKRRRENEIIASGRKTKKPNWKKDGRKMQNTKPMKRYKTISGGNSFKKESVDPDEKDKTKQRNLQLGTMKHFMDFYGLDD